MNRIVLTYLTMLLAFFLIDLIWLGIVAKPLYRQQIGFILADKFNWAAAISFYLIFLVGLLCFVVLPNKGQSMAHVALMGALFGFVTYSAYDLTNLATLKNWPITITLIDLLWGSCLSTIVSLVGFWVIR